MTTLPTYYKVLGPNGEACHGGSGQWALPAADGEPGAWMPAIADPVCCKRGYHVVTANGLLDWLTRSDQQVWIAEVRGTRHSGDGHKVAVAEARLVQRLQWNEQIARAFACDCAERVLPVFEKQFSTDLRPRNAVDVARRYLRGAATGDELKQAAEAAWAAWVEAAVAAAWAAARAAEAAAEAAEAAAVAAAWAAEAAAEAAERQGQTERLLAYLHGEVFP